MEAFLLAMSIPSGIIGLCFWLLQRKLDKREKAREEKEKIREQQEFLLVKSIGASRAIF